MMTYFRSLPRRTGFLFFNAAAFFLLLGFVLGPLVAHFSSRADELAQSAAELAELKQLLAERKAGRSLPPTQIDPFLAGNENRVISADLQANLKAIASTAGARILRVRGLPDSRVSNIDMVTVSLELEGSLHAVKDVAFAIESQVPFLFIAAASLRTIGEGEQALIRAELKVQGAIRSKARPGQYDVSERSNAAGARDLER